VGRCPRGAQLTSDYRFRHKKAGSNAMLAPTAVKGGAGLSLVGMF
jgi:hypothetical protein